MSDLDSNRSAAQIERRAKRIWVGIIVAFLGLQLFGGIITVYLAVSDPTVAVIPNYYQSGLNWDVTKRNLDQFTNLGWTVIVQVQEADAESQSRQLAVQLKRGNSVVGKQRVSASIFHHARGNEIHRINFDEALEGQYVASCKLIQSGLWQFDVVFEGDHGIAETRFAVNVENTGPTEFHFPEIPEKAKKY